MYKINGYDLFLALGILPDGDRTTADSFENPIRKMADVFTHTWPDGVVEYDLQAPVTFKPRIFIVKGFLTVDNEQDYYEVRQTISNLIHVPYLTLEQEASGIKANARLRPDGDQWNRITHLGGRITIRFQMQFDEVMQDVPFIDNGLFTFDVDSQMDLSVEKSNNSIFNFSLNNKGELIMTT